MRKGFDLETYLNHFLLNIVMPETITMQDLFKELRAIKQSMVSKEEMTSLFETMEILHHPETMRQVRKSEEDIRSGRTKKIGGVKDLLAEIE